jgi:hypothetical protein
MSLNGCQKDLRTKEYHLIRYLCSKSELRSWSDFLYRRIPYGITSLIQGNGSNSLIFEYSSRPEAGFLVWFRYVPCSTKVCNSIPVPNLTTRYVPQFQRYFEGDGADLYCIC